MAVSSPTGTGSETVTLPGRRLTGCRGWHRFFKLSIYRGCVKMMHPLFRYIIIVLPFFIEYDLCFSYVHAFWGYNVL